jgi:hypothetical protein
VRRSTSSVRSSVSRNDHRVWPHAGEVRQARHLLEGVTRSNEAARKAASCRDFIVAADPIEDDRVNVYEEWETVKAMLAFRGDGPDSGMI